MHSSAPAAKKQWIGVRLVGSSDFFFVVVVVVVVVVEEEFSRHSMTCLTRPVAGSSTILDRGGTDSSPSLDQVDLRWSSDVDLASGRELRLTPDVVAHQADTRYAPSQLRSN